jgi:DNA-binding NarL/FixJ family response regulator
MDTVRIPPPNGPKIRILIATEEPVLALGASSLLATAGDFELTAAPSTYAQLERFAGQEQPDLILLDATAEITPALFAIARRAAPAARIVLWARGISDELRQQAVEFGVAGFLRKTLPNSQMIDQLRRIAHGVVLVDHLQPAGPFIEVKLSRRESQIIALLSQGLKNKEIASALELSDGTIKSYLVRLFRKVGARDRFELAVLGLKNIHCGEAFWDGPGAFVTGPEPVRARPVLRSLVLVQPARRRGYSDVPPLRKAVGVCH